MPQKRRPKKSGSSGSPGSKSGPFRILLAVVGMGLFYFFFIRTVPAPQSGMPASTAPTAAKDPVKEKFDFLPPPETRAPEAPVDVKALRAGALKNRMFGIKSVKLDSLNGEVQIPLQFFADKRWCEGGDLDTFKYLLDDENKTSILVTIETLTSTQRGDRYRTSLKKLYEGFERTFKITPRNEPESIGLFICTESEGKSSCRGKELIPHDQLSNMLADKSKADVVKSKDYLLYFQNFILKDGKLVSYSNTDISKEGSSALRSHLEDTLKVKQADSTAAYGYNKVLRSVPAKVEGNKIVLKLPYNDPRCLPGNREPATE